MSFEQTTKLALVHPAKKRRPCVEFVSSRTQEFDCDPGSSHDFQSIFSSSRRLPYCTFCPGSTVFLTTAGTGVGRMELKFVLGRAIAKTKVVVSGSWIVYVLLAATNTAGIVTATVECATDQKLFTLTTFELEDVSACDPVHVDLQVKGANAHVELATFWASMQRSSPYSRPSTPLVSYTQHELTNIPKGRWRDLLTDPPKMSVRSRGFFVEYKLTGQVLRTTTYFLKFLVGGTWSPAVGPVIVPFEDEGVWAIWVTIAVADGVAFLVLSVWPDESATQVQTRRFAVVGSKASKLRVRAKSTRADYDLIGAVLDAYPGRNNATEQLTSCCASQTRTLTASPLLPVEETRSVAVAAGQPLVVNDTEIAAFSFTKMPSQKDTVAIVFNINGNTTSNAFLTIVLVFGATQVTIPFTNPKSEFPASDKKRLTFTVGIDVYLDRVGASNYHVSGPQSLNFESSQRVVNDFSQITKMTAPRTDFDTCRVLARVSKSGIPKEACDITSCTVSFRD